MRSALAFVLLFCCCSTASGGTVLDQEWKDYDLPDHSWSAFIISTASRGVAQVFTVGVSGTLSSVQLQLYRDAPTTGQMLVQVLPVAEGLPDALNPLATIDIDVTTIPTGLLGTQVEFDLSPFNLAVEDGQQYAIFLSRSDTDYIGKPYVAWVFGQPLAGYTRGSAFRPDGEGSWTEWDDDLVFKTFVTIPEPSTYALAALGLATLVAAKRRKPSACRNHS